MKVYQNLFYLIIIIIIIIMIIIIIIIITACSCTLANVTLSHSVSKDLHDVFLDVLKFNKTLLPFGEALPPHGGKELGARFKHSLVSRNLLPWAYTVMSQSSPFSLH